MKKIGWIAFGFILVGASGLAQPPQKGGIQQFALPNEVAKEYLKQVQHCVDAKCYRDAIQAHADAARDEMNGIELDEKVQRAILRACRGKGGIPVQIQCFEQQLSVSDHADSVEVETAKRKFNSVRSHLVQAGVLSLHCQKGDAGVFRRAGKDAKTGFGNDKQCELPKFQFAGWKKPGSDPALSATRTMLKLEKLVDLSPPAVMEYSSSFKIMRYSAETYESTHSLDAKKVGELVQYLSNHLDAEARVRVLEQFNALAKSPKSVDDPKAIDALRGLLDQKKDAQAVE